MLYLADRIPSFGATPRVYEAGPFFSCLSVLCIALVI
jgi:hypothetical protein